MTIATFPITDLFEVAGIPAEITAVIGSLDGDISALLSNLNYAGFSQSYSADGSLTTVDLVVTAELQLDIGVPNVFSIVVDQQDGPCVVGWFAGDSEYELRLAGVPIALRIDPQVLKPVDLTQADVRIALGGQLVANSVLGISFDALALITIPPSIIANSGFVVSATGIAIDFGLGSSSFGVTAQNVTLEPPSWLSGILPADAQLQNVSIGRSGFTGKLEVDFSSQNQPPQGGTVFGLGFSPAAFILDIQNNSFKDAQLSGSLSLPFIGDGMPATLTFSRQSGTTAQLLITDAGTHTIAIPSLSGASITFSDLKISALLDSSADLSLSASVSSLSIALPGGLTASLSAGTLQFSDTGANATLSLAAGTMTIPPFPQLTGLSLQLSDQGSNESLALNAHLTWHDVAAQYPAVASMIPQGVPVPGDLTDARVSFTWQEQGSKTTLKVHIECDVDPLALTIASALPANVRPQFEDSMLTIDVAYTDATATTQQSLSVALAAKIKPAIPDLSALGVTVQGGDADGWIGVSVSAQAGNTTALTVQILDPVTLSFELPGVTQATPPLVVALTSLNFNATSSSAAITFSGTFALSPIVPSAGDTIAAHIAAFFGAGIPTLNGNFSGKLTFGANPTFSAQCTLQGASVSANVIDLLSRLVHGAVNVQADEIQAQIPLSSIVGFTLNQIRLVLAGGASPSLTLAVDVKTDLFGLIFDSFLELGTDHLAIGLDNVDIPLRPPRFPLAPSQLAAATANDYDASFFRTTAPSYGHTAEALLLDLRDLRQTIAPANQPTFDRDLKALIDAFAALSGFFDPHTNAKVSLSNLRIIAPFADMSQLRAEGSASIVGLGSNDPLKPLESLAFIPGVSTKRIFFSLKPASGQDIEVKLPPAAGRYAGSVVKLAMLSIGYGFTDNSLSFALGAELDLAPQFVTDASASRSAAFGVRLPTTTSVSIQLDAIPIPPPSPIPVLPVLSFDFDLRSAQTGPPPSDPCTIVWDGLQLITPVLQADFKHLAASPYLGPFPLPHATFSGDLVFGISSSTGISVLIDEMTWFPGYSMPVGFEPIPLLADPTAPYFNNLCLAIEIAGIGVHGEYQRPFPTFSPDALFELIALIAQPDKPVNPNGALANTMRADLTNVAVTFPGFLRRWFPALDTLEHDQLNYRINLGNVIDGIQAVVAALKAAWSTLEAATGDIAHALGSLVHGQFSLGSFLALVPPEFRRISTQATLGPFDAAALLVIIDAKDAKALFDLPPVQVHGRPALTLGSSLDPATFETYRPPAGGGVAYDPTLSQNHVLDDPLLRQFTSQDLADVPAGANGILFAASVRLVPASAELDFIGYLFDDGSFSLDTALGNAPAVPVSVGVLPPPITIFARFNLSAIKTSTGYEVVAVAMFRAEWEPLPGINVLIGGDKGAVIEIFGNGRFLVQGTGSITLFTSEAVMRGALRATEAVCSVSGSFGLNIPSPTGSTPLVNLQLSSSASIGPGLSYYLEGTGALELLGHGFVNVHGRASDKYLDVTCQLSSWDNGSAGGFLSLPCVLDASLSGRFDFTAGNESFTLQGSGSLALTNNTLLDPQIQGSFSVSASQNAGLSVGVQGSLWWQGRDWLDGAISLSETGFSISGHTSFAVDSWANSIGPVSMAGLVLRLDVGGDFDLDFSSGLLSYDIEGSCELAVQFPAVAQDQGTVLPIVMTKFAESSSLSLFDITLIDIPNVCIPLPQIPDITIPFSVDVNNIGTITIGTHNYSIAGVGVTIPVVDIQLPDFSGNLPDTADSGTQLTPINVYDLTVSGNPTTITFPTQITIPVGLTIRLVWEPQQKQLCLVVNNTYYDLTGVSI